MKKIYLIRHCEAKGQQPEATLTNNGYRQALHLAEFFSNKQVDRIISSPYRRAIESIKPLGYRLNMDIEIDERLTERVLSSENLSDWFEKLRATFWDHELKFDGGESSQEAMNRIVQVIGEIFEHETKNTIIVTHGNLMSLLLHYYDKEFGFKEWKNLSNPDVFLLTLYNYRANFSRLWNTN